MNNIRIWEASPEDTKVLLEYVDFALMYLDLR